MTPEQAIEKAIEGGWDDTDYAFLSDSDSKHNYWTVGEWQYDEKVFLDPRFWRAVGKIQGWGSPPEFRCAVEVNVYWFPMRGDSRVGEHILEEGRRNRIKYHVQKSAKVAEDEGWEFQMHRMIDALCEASHSPDFNVNKAIEEYLRNL